MWTLIKNKKELSAYLERQEGRVIPHKPEHINKPICTPILIITHIIPNGMVFRLQHIYVTVKDACDLLNVAKEEK